MLRGKFSSVSKSFCSWLLAFGAVSCVFSSFKLFWELLGSWSCILFFKGAFCVSRAVSVRLLANSAFNCLFSCSSSFNFRSCSAIFCAWASFSFFSASFSFLSSSFSLLKFSKISFNSWIFMLCSCSKFFLKLLSALKYSWLYPCPLLSSCIFFHSAIISFFVSSSAFCSCAYCLPLLCFLVALVSW